MNKISKISIVAGKVISVTLIGIAIIIIGLSVSPIYRFEAPQPFSGDKIYNPYSALDTSIGWKRANFHTHTHATAWLNECELYPDGVLKYYDSYHYDIVSFSNHQELTTFPGNDTSRQIWVYEHGYNFFKFHQLLFGAEKVSYYDNFLPFLSSQKQFIIDMMSKQCDFVVFNHPDRTLMISTGDMQRLTGYRLIEADAGAGTDLKHWDEALSSGRYSLNVINDDLHKPQQSSKIARRCSFVNTPSRNYHNVKEALLAGNFYSMNIPDFGNGDLDIKHAENESLPSIRYIGMSQDTILMTLSSPAKTIEAITQDGKIVKTLSDTSSFSYVMTSDDPYLRMTARFENEVVIYTNPFAWYSSGDTPYREISHPIIVWATILFNLFLAALIAVFILFATKILGVRP